MSNATDADALLIAGQRNCGKTTLAEYLAGGMQKPVVMMGNQEWADYSPLNGTFRDFKETVEHAARSGQRPPSFLYVGPRHDVEQAIQYISGDRTDSGEGVEGQGMGCTMLIDEIYRFLPRSRKSNPYLVDCLKRGRHLAPRQAGISVVGMAHKFQDVDTEMISQAALVGFRMKQKDAASTADRYFADEISFGELEKYEFACGDEVEWLSFDVGRPGRYTWTLDMQGGKIVQHRSF